MKSSLLLALMMFASTSAHAGEVTGPIEYVQTGHGYTPDNVYVLVRVSAATTNPATCATDPRFAVNSATSAGKNMLALLTTAHVSGRKVYLVGTGNCSIMGGQETLSWMRLLD